MKKLNNDIVDQRLINRNIKRLDNYINRRLKMSWVCLKKQCGFIWRVPAHNILNGGNGCPKCAGTLKLNNDVIDERLLDKNIKRIDNYINSHTEIMWQCKKENCKYSWKATPSNISLGISGCPKCVGVAKLTNKIIDDLLVGRPIKRIENCVNSSTRISWKCLNRECSHLWKTTPNYILNSYGGCPLCKNKNEKLIFSMLKINNIDFEYHKNIKEFGANKNYRVDFFMPTTNIIIEYNGSQHYNAERFGGIDKDLAIINFNKQKKRDNYIRNFCKKNKIELIEIDGRIFNSEKLKSAITHIMLPYLFGKIK